MAINPNELPRCAVKGLVAPRAMYAVGASVLGALGTLVVPRAMCACVMMGGRCGTKGPCQHKLDPKPATASWPYDSEGTPVEVEA